MRNDIKKYLVVGANSFLGAEIVKRLKIKSDVTGIYHKSKDKLDGNIENVPVSLINTLEDEYDVVFIISAHIPDKNKVADAGLLNEVNVDLPDMICKKFKKSRIIYASSVSVYPESVGIIDESTEVSPDSDYGKSKVFGEKVVSRHSQNCIVRISSMYGIGMNRSTFLPVVIDTALNSGVIKLYGKGERSQNYIHVSDVADFFILLAQKGGNNTYLAVGERSYSNLEIAAFIKKELSGVKIDFTREDQSPSFFYDASVSYTSLNFKPEKNIEKGIIELIRWQKKF